MQARSFSYLRLGQGRSRSERMSEILTIDDLAKLLKMSRGQVYTDS
jgi:hypothetical protein